VTISISWTMAHHWGHAYIWVNLEKMLAPDSQCHPMPNQLIIFSAEPLCISASWAKIVVLSVKISISWTMAHYWGHAYIWVNLEKMLAPDSQCHPMPNQPHSLFSRTLMYLVELSKNSGGCLCRFLFLEPWLHLGTCRNKGKFLKKWGSRSIKVIPWQNNSFSFQPDPHVSRRAEQK